MEKIFNNLVSNAQSSGIEFTFDSENMERVAGIRGLFEAAACYANPETGIYHKEIICFNPWSITLDNPITKLKVLCHELGHATGSKARLNRFRIANNLYTLKLSPTQSRLVFFIEELTAERIAQRCLTYLQIDCPNQYNKSNEYISWFMDSTITEEMAWQIELDSQAGFNYIVNNWMNKEVVRVAA